jgi:hypothetical protein
LLPPRFVPKRKFMSTPSATASTAAPHRPFCPVEFVKPFLVPYYLTIAAVLGAITTVFVVLCLVLVLIVTNFNVLGWME